MAMSAHLQAADAARARVRSSQQHLGTLNAEVEAEMDAVMARMQQRKAWSRRDEIEEEAAQVEAAEAEAARLEQQRQEEAARRDAIAKARAAKAAAALEEARRNEAAQQAMQQQQEALKRAAKQAAAKMATERAHGADPRAKEDAPSSAEQSASAGVEAAATDGAGMLEGLFGGLMVKSPSSEMVKSPSSETGGAAATGAPAPPSAAETELDALRSRYKAADRRVHELRATGGIALQQAYDELKPLKAEYRKKRADVHPEQERQLAAKAKREERPGGGRAEAGGKSMAGTVSARRLERQRARLEARGGGMVF